MDKNKRQSVSSLEIQHFRGISDKREIKFSKDERIVVLCGENGTGKSTFVNALEYMFKNDMDIFNRRIKGKTKSFVHTGSKNDDLEIRLYLNKNDYICKKYNQNPTSKSKVGRRFLRNNKSFLEKASFILTRNKLLEFVTSSGTGKYDSLMKLCSLDDLENIKDQFKSVKNHFNSKLRSKKNDLENSKIKINNILECDGNYLENINKDLQLINCQLIDEKTDLEQYLTTLDFQDKYDTQNNLNKFDELYQKIDIEDISLKLENLLNEYDCIKNDSLVSLNYSSKLLFNSQKYLENTNENKCPVCGNEVENKELINKIESELVEVKNLISNFDMWKNDVKNYIKVLNILNSQFKDINHILNKLEIDLTIDEIDLINDLNDLVSFKIFEIDYDFNPIKKNLLLIKEKIEEKKKLLSQDENYDKIKNLRKAINELINYNHISADIKNLELKYDLALKTFNSYNETKKHYLKDIAQKMEKNFQKYYKFLHGDDLLNFPELDVISDNSLGLLVDAFGEKSDPILYSSEGHLDTLGLCIFLAFMREYNPIDLIVLDDIITTVDFSHKYNIAKLLIEEFYDFNILITTHNGLWAQQLSDIAESTKSRKVKVENIISWDLISGPHIIVKKKYPELIDKYLEDGESQVAAVNTSRQYLEYATLEYCKSNPVNIVIGDKYTLRPLYDAVKKATYNKRDERLDELWDELDKNYFIVNKLSHYNNDAFYIHSNEINQLCDLVKEICPMLISYKGN